MATPHESEKQESPKILVDALVYQHGPIRVRITRHLSAKRMQRKRKIRYTHIFSHPWNPDPELIYIQSLEPNHFESLCSER